MEDLVKRVERLERQNRNLKRVVTVAALGCVVAVLMGVSRERPAFLKTLVVEELIVSGPDGKLRATFTHDNDGAALIMGDPTTRHHPSLILRSDPSAVSVEMKKTGAKTPDALLTLKGSAAHFSLQNPSAKQPFFMVGTPDGRSAILVIQNGDGTSRAGFGVAKDGTAVSLTDSTQ